jgi:hypothetical protein
LALVAVCFAPAPAAFAQAASLPVGTWRSPPSATHTNPAYTSSELYLDIQVGADGAFRGTWGQYFCTAYPGAYGVGVYSCTRTGGQRVSGRFGADRKGTIDLDRLGRSAFTWAAPAADELAIELPKHWQGSDAILYRARMTRDGKARPQTATPSAPARDEGPLLSANALYREFRKDERAALARHAGRTLVLEGRRGRVIALSDGGAAVHVPDGFTDRALVLFFRSPNDVGAIGEGAAFRFRCTVANFDYQYVQMENCSVER